MRALGSISPVGFWGSNKEMGAMDGDPPLPPGYHIYVDSMAPWHTITDDLPQYSTEPDD